MDSEVKSRGGERGGWVCVCGGGVDLLEGQPLFLAHGGAGFGGLLEPTAGEVGHEVVHVREAEELEVGRVVCQHLVRRQPAVDLGHDEEVLPGLAKVNPPPSFGVCG